MNDMTATPAQKKELTIAALEIAGFTEKDNFQGMYTMEHGMKTVVVNVNESPIKPYFNVDGKKITEDDEYDTLAKVSKMITEAEDGQMPSRTEADVVVNVTSEPEQGIHKHDIPAEQVVADTPSGIGRKMMPDEQIDPEIKQYIEDTNSLSDDDPAKVTAEMVTKQAPAVIIHSAAPAVPSDLSVSTIKKYINDRATDEEAYVFLQLCKARGLNPFLKEAYLIKYDHVSPATMVVGKDAFMKRAELHPEYDGFEAGIIVEYKDSSGFVIVDENRVGTFLRDEETLLGGWAKVYRKDHTRPVEITVSMKEFNTGKSSWKKMPAIMIRKVALVQGHREAFPSEMSGMDDQSEMGVDV